VFYFALIRAVNCWAIVIRQLRTQSELLGNWKRALVQKPLQLIARLE
jgi:hypothetical protein